MSPRAFAALVLGLGLLLAPAGADARGDDWKAYANARYGVATSLPAEPQVQDIVEDGDPTLIVAAQPEPDIAYVLRISLMRTPANRLEGLRYTLDNVLTSDLGPVLERRELTVQGNPAVEAVVGPGDDGLYARIRLVATETGLISLITTSRSRPPLDRFYTDFTLSAPAPQD